MSAKKNWPNYPAPQEMLLYSLRGAERLKRIIGIVSKNISFAALRRNPSNT